MLLLSKISAVISCVHNAIKNLRARSKDQNYSHKYVAIDSKWLAKLSIQSVKRVKELVWLRLKAFKSSAQLHLEVSLITKSYLIGIIQTKIEL